MPSTNLPLDEMRAGLALLLKAYDLARDASCEISEFAVEIDRLHRHGFLVEHLRWLIAKGYGRHLVEVTEDGNDKRVFHPAKNRFHKHSCIILLEAGAEFARQVCQKPGKAAGVAERQPRHKRATSRRTPASGKPRWNAEKRILEFRGEILRSYTRSARNQQAALDRFEALGWPETIDCRSFLKGSNLKSQIHNTINPLNKNQRVKRLRFMPDGTGFGMKWAVLPRGPARRRPAVRSNSGHTRRNGRGKS